MSMIDRDLLKEPLLGRTGNKGPVTMMRQRRALMVYGAIWLIGLSPLFLGWDASWQAAGLGLWLPGAGFLAVGGWAIALFPLTLFLFVAAIVAWFWAGIVLAPILVWGGAAVISGLLVGEEPTPYAYIFTALMMAAMTTFVLRKNTARRVQLERKALKRASFLPASLAEVNELASKVPDAASRELSVEQLQAARYLFDRALQPVDEWNGFNVIDQFQPAALRYQINHMGFALGILQGAYTPNFSGYLGTAQRNLIDKYLMRKVWGYWVYESCWGHLNFTNFDPADKDNIMLTGWFGMHVGQYMLNSGDERYKEPGSLTFKLNGHTSYSHNFQSIVGSVAKNYSSHETEFGLYPCEPNWIYPICNHYGMSSLAVHDEVCGTNYVENYLPMWLEKQDTEFTDASGSIIGLRSQHLGIEVPFPVGEQGYASFANIFAPMRAKRLWAVARKELEQFIVVQEDGSEELVMPGKGLDPGNYRTGFCSIFGSILVSAKEFGDVRMAQAAQNSLNHQCGQSVVDGVQSYTTGSNISNATIVMGQLMQTGDFRRSFVEGPSPECLEGPQLSEAPYPAVLVAKAISDGKKLDLVLYPGAEGGTEIIELARLVPNASYAVVGAVPSEFVALNDGTISLKVALYGRTVLEISPID